MVENSIEEGLKCNSLLQEILKSAGLLEALGTLENNEADDDEDDEDEDGAEGENAEDELTAAFAKAGIN